MGSGHHDTLPRRANHAFFLIGGAASAGAIEMVGETRVTYDDPHFLDAVAACVEAQTGLLDWMLAEPAFQRIADMYEQGAP